MELEFSIISILDTAGFLQGFIVGVLLIILNKKKHRSTLFIGVFLVLYSLERIPDIIKDLNLSEAYPELHLLPLISMWIIYPVFFIYTQQISILQDEKTKYWLLYPGLLFYAFQICVYFLPYETKLELAPKTWFKLCYFIGILFGWFVAIWNIKLIDKHKIEVNNQFSMTQFKELRWARTFLIISIIGSILYIIQYYLLDKNIYSSTFFLLFNLLIIYWISYHGIKQFNIISLNTKGGMFESFNKEPMSIQNYTSKTSNKSNPKLMEQINSYMTNNSAYANADLTILDLASQLNVHPKLISGTINSIQKQNFNAYVNQYRIHKAIILLRNNKDENLSIEGIGYEVGFHSKSSFYGAFKKVTQTTPTRYKAKHVA